MTRLAILNTLPRHRIIDAGAASPLDRITHIMPEP
jgi:hypothetical protein